MQQLRVQQTGAESYNYNVFIAVKEQAGKLVANVVQLQEDGAEHILQTYVGQNALDLRTKLRNKKLRCMAVRHGAHLLRL